MYDPDLSEGRGGVGGGEGNVALTIRNQDAGSSRQSYGKVGDCEQSSKNEPEAFS